MKIIALQGLPASGKTRFARDFVNKAKGNYIRVNKDDLREMLFPGLNQNRKRERHVVKTQVAMVKNALESGLNVVIDDPNFDTKHLKQWENLAKEFDAAYELKTMDTSVEDCVLNDRAREGAGMRFVGAQIIECMAYQHGVVDQGPCILVDLDGTLADHSYRLNASTREDGSIDWDTFLEPGRIALDAPRQEIIDEVNAYKEEHACDMIIVSGRSSGYLNIPWINREITINWLQRHRVNFDRLIMRQHKDYRADEKLKEKFLDSYIGCDNVLRVWEDRPKVIRMWESRGLDVRDCNESGREF